MTTYSKYDILKMSKDNKNILFKKGADNYGREENHKERSSRNDVSR